ncbi:lysoplasmalogenase [Undibacterium sp. CY18W]|uniref:Lysoplasmalogenase n=1 Tax=Undibacterium hunanense TaxID=2762292 RepID=A0ABR6ZXW7_9BURK|nr:lysoplasmalogenase [Undibacterium hunanense]MBC3920707.1 lysoplasmalogenase [Undibacterium hunanense]
MSIAMRSALIVLFAVLAIAGAELGGSMDGAQFLHYAFKPLTTLSIFFLALRAQPAINVRYRQAILVGILFSLLGDIFLMLPVSLLPQGFLLGLLSFLFAHLCFLRALCSDTSFFAKPLVFAALAALGAAHLFVLWPGLPPAMRIPVVAYVCLLLAMCAQAISRGISLRTVDSRLAMSGGICFMLSDTILAYNKFYTPIPHSPLLILASYYLALWLIARSVQASPSAHQDQGRDHA